jgi:ribosome-associated protein
MDDVVIVTDDVRIPSAEIWFTASRSGGPGGQHVNKTSSRVTLHWNVNETSCLSEAQKARVMHRLASRITSEGILQFSVDGERSRHQNQENAIERLRAMIQQALIIPKKRIPTKSSLGSKIRRLKAKALVGETKRRRMSPKIED